MNINSDCWQFERRVVGSDTCYTLAPALPAWKCIVYAALFHWSLGWLSCVIDGIRGAIPCGFRDKRNLGRLIWNSLKRRITSHTHFFDHMYHRNTVLCKSCTCTINVLVQNVFVVSTSMRGHYGNGRTSVGYVQTTSSSFVYFQGMESPMLAKY